MNLATTYVLKTRVQAYQLSKIVQGLHLCTPLPEEGTPSPHAYSATPHWRYLDQTLAPPGSRSWIRHWNSEVGFEYLNVSAFTVIILNNTADFIAGR